MKHLRSYELGVKFYHAAKSLQLPGHLKDQLLRAASSVVLNLAEGTGKRTMIDQRRFFYIALGSVREIQAITALEKLKFSPIELDLLDHLAASVFKLARYQGS